MSNHEIYYFGCWNDVGHFLHDHRGTVRERSLPNDFPISRFEMLDSGFLPKGLPQKEGRLHFWRTNGWMIIAFWDRSIDSRPGSNSAFIMRCDNLETDRECLKRASEAYPHIFKRFKFKLTIDGLPSWHDEITPTVNGVPM